MTNDHALHYDHLLERALRGVVRDALSYVAEKGLPGDHHFYISFATTMEGVEIPDHLRKQYPHEMTVVLQYQFYGLKIIGDAFTVTLSFSGKPERLVIPLNAIHTFADPSVNFALQFQSFEDDGDEKDAADQEKPKQNTPPTKDDVRGEVISLDKFRRKDPPQ